MGKMLEFHKKNEINWICLYKPFCWRKTFDWLGDCRNNRQITKWRSINGILRKRGISYQCLITDQYLSESLQNKIWKLDNPRQCLKWSKIKTWDSIWSSKIEKFEATTFSLKTNWGPVGRNIGEKWNYWSARKNRYVDGQRESFGFVIVPLIKCKSHYDMTEGVLFEKLEKSDLLTY